MTDSTKAWGISFMIQIGIKGLRDCSNNSMLATLVPYLSIASGNFISSAVEALPYALFSNKNDHLINKLYASSLLGK